VQDVERLVDALDQVEVATARLRQLGWFRIPKD
jgi:hypothetical protein